MEDTPAKHTLPVRFRWRWLFAGACLGFLLLLGVRYFVGRISLDRIPLLLPENGARWLRHDKPIELSGLWPSDTATAFRRAVQIPDSWRGGILHVKAVRKVRVFIDNNLAFDSGNNLADWNRTHNVILGRGFRPGHHVLGFHVTNYSGPCLLIASCDELQLKSAEAQADDSSDIWQSSEDLINWSPAIDAATVRGPSDSRWMTVTNLTSFSSVLWLSLFMFASAATAVISRASRARALETEIRARDWASVVRWILLLVCVVLGVNKFFRIPWYLGYDAEFHLQYIREIANHARIPLAPEGWQYFQSPLFYLVSAQLYIVLKAVFIRPTAVLLLRVIPIACGLLQIEIGYRSSRLAFPSRTGLQVIATTVAALLPMNLYMSQFLSNEPLAGCLSAAVFLLSLQMLIERKTPSRRAVLVCGTVLGFALLAKVTAILTTIPAMVVLTVAVHRNSASAGQFLRTATSRLFLLVLAAATVSGWYYARNQYYLGVPFMSGWDPARIAWWQEPGYRVPEHFTRFGLALFHPIYSATAGVWDSLYSTLWADGLSAGRIYFDYRSPWNYQSVIVCIWLSLALTLAVVFAIVHAALALFQKRSFDSTPIQAAWLSVLTIAPLLVALLWLYLNLPIYGCGKASYLLGATPCLGILVAYGFGPLLRLRWTSALVGGIVVCWACASYSAFFIVH